MKNFEEIKKPSIKTTLNTFELPESPEGFEGEGVEEFLNMIKETGEVNMYGCTPLLMETFGCGKKLAREWLSYYFALGKANNPCS